MDTTKRPTFMQITTGIIIDGFGKEHMPTEERPIYRVERTDADGVRRAYLTYIKQEAEDFCNYIEEIK